MSSSKPHLHLRHDLSTSIAKPDRAIWPWAFNCLAGSMIERCVFILLSLAVVGSLGGFFLYVPILPNLAVTAVLGGLCAMFWLGIRVGRRPHDVSVPNAAPAEDGQLSLS
jgi:hypothetical protein